MLRQPGKRLKRLRSDAVMMLQGEVGGTAVRSLGMACAELGGCVEFERIIRSLPALFFQVVAQRT